MIGSNWSVNLLSGALIPPFCSEPIGTKPTSAISYVGLLRKPPRALQTERSIAPARPSSDNLDVRFAPLEVNSTHSVRLHIK